MFLRSLTLEYARIQSRALAKTAIVILAAGASTRMGSAKQLLEYRGKPLVRHAAEMALASKAGAVFVVLGARAPEVGQALEGLPVRTVGNPHWEQGMGASIRAGIGAAQAEGLEGVVLTLADLPLVTPQILDKLVLEHVATGRPIVASQYCGTVGVPAYFAREFFPHLLALRPDQGCKGVILSHAGRTLQIDCPEAAVDIDTPRDYERIVAGQVSEPRA